MSLSRTLYSLFFDSCTAYAVGYLNDQGKAGYRSVEGIPTLELIQEHLDRKTTLGAYTVIPGNTVRWMAWDIDSTDLKVAKELTKKLSDWLTEQKIPHFIEFSGSKGYHIIVLFLEKESAETAKLAGEMVRDHLGLRKNGDPHVEVFPKQGELTESNPLGNLLRLPFGMHPAKKVVGRLVNTTDWEDGEEINPEPYLEQKTTLSALQRVLHDQDPFQMMVDLLAPYWETGQRHDISLYLSGFLATVDWTEDAVIDLISAIHEQSPEGDLDDQLKTVTSTFKKYYDGGKIIGLTGLNDILPGSVMKQLLDLATKQTSSAALQIIDRERLSKGPTFLKVRRVAQTVINYFKENGRLVRDIGDIYWLNRETHELISMGDPAWDRMIHNTFGINLSESFGKQVAESIRHYAHADAREVKAQKRSYWDGSRLYINLGGPEIYILNGKKEEREIVLNGEIDIFFKNSEDTLRLPNLQTVDDSSLSPWPFLTDDVNFKPGDTIDATPIQQRELFKAFVCSIFFAQALPTRPILIFLAPSGAGKTTAARRILRLLEGTNQEVLNILPDKPDSFRVSISVHKLLVLDNLEKTKAAWLTDSLNRISTGAHIELRELHTTNRMKKIVPDCFLIITATEIPFSEETVYTRLLPIELAPLTNSIAEGQIQADLINNFNGLWKGMLDDLDKVVAELNKVKTVEVPSETRLADFNLFCNRIKGVDFLEGDELLKGLESLVSRQKRVLEENSPLTEVVKTYLRTRTETEAKWMSMSEVFSLFQRIANSGKIEWRFSTSQGLSRHMTMLEPQLIRYYGMSVKKVMENGRETKQYKFDKKTLQM